MTTTPTTDRTLYDMLLSERELLGRRYSLAMDRATNLVTDYYKRPASTHLGHNLGSIAVELSELAGKIEEVTGILNTLVELTGEKKL